MYRDGNWNTRHELPGHDRGATVPGVARRAGRVATSTPTGYKYVCSLRHDFSSELPETLVEFVSCDKPPFRKRAATEMLDPDCAGSTGALADAVVRSRRTAPSDAQLGSRPAGAAWSPRRRMSRVTRGDAVRADPAVNGAPADPVQVGWSTSGAPSPRIASVRARLADRTVVTTVTVDVLDTAGATIVSRSVGMSSAAQRRVVLPLGVAAPSSGGLTPSSALAARAIP